MLLLSLDADARGMIDPQRDTRFRQILLQKSAIGWASFEEAEQSNSLDFVSERAQIEFDRNANAKRSDFPFENLSDGTRFSVPWRSFRRRPGE
jgi:hypothetical protein